MWMMGVEGETGRGGDLGKGVLEERGKQPVRPGHPNQKTI